MVEILQTVSLVSLVMGMLSGVPYRLPTSDFYPGEKLSQTASKRLGRLAGLSTQRPTFSHAHLIINNPALVSSITLALSQHPQHNTQSFICILAYLQIIVFIFHSVLMIYDLVQVIIVQLYTVTDWYVISIVTHSCV